MEKWLIITVVLVSLGGSMVLTPAQAMATETEGEQVVLSGPASEQASSSTLTTEATWGGANFIQLSVTYRVDATVEPGTMTPGESVPWKITLSNSEVKIDGTVNLGSVSSDFSEVVPLPIGSSTTVPVPSTGQKIKIQLETSAVVENIQVTAGPAKVEESRVPFDVEGTKEFTVTASEEASVGETVKTTATVVPSLKIGVRESVPLVGPGEIAGTSVDAPPFSPRIEASTEVEETGLPVIPIAVGGIVLVGAIGAYYTYSSAGNGKPSKDVSSESAEATAATTRSQTGASATSSPMSQQDDSKDASDDLTEHGRETDSVEFFGTPKKKLESFPTPGYALSRSKPKHNISTYKHDSIIKPAIEKVLNEDSQIQKYKKESESDWVAMRVGEGSLFIQLEASVEKETTVISVEARGVPDDANYDQLGFSKKFEDLLREDQLPDKLSDVHSADS